MTDTEIVFQVKHSPEGGYEAHAVGHNIFTEADDWEHLKQMMREAVLCHFEDGEAPRTIARRCRGLSVGTMVERTGATG